ncbi:C-type mannose receptor 2-like [Menidia menidia]
MEKVLLLAAAAGLAGAALPGGRRYTAVYEAKTWAEARRHCQEEHTDLAVVDSLLTAQTLNAMFNRSLTTEKYYWIGLSEDSWRWSSPVDDSDYRNWEFGEPDNGYLNEYCVNMFDNGEWQDVPCDWTERSVCYDIQGSDVTFFYVDELLTMADAQKNCLLTHKGLATVRDRSDNLQIQNLANGERVWIGLFRDGWQWVDGSPLSFTYWGENEPNSPTETCVVAKAEESGKWGNISGNNRFPFFCYTAVVHKQVLRVKLEGAGADLEDPALLQDLLQKIRRMLRDQGLNSDFRLSWKKQADGKIFHKEENDEL